ncbi:SPRY domain-containing 3, partial [Brachionus plicatilis]
MCGSKIFFIKRFVLFFEINYLIILISLNNIVKNGNSIGWGVFYNPDSVDKNDKSEQLILVFVTFNESIIDVLFVLQPEGGFFPLVLMQPWSTRVRLEIYSTLCNEDVNKLTKFYHAKLAPAIEIYNKDMTESTIDPNDIRISDNEIEKIIDKTKTIIRIPKTKSGVHYIQFRKPITPERRFFFVELIKVGSGTNVVLGIASSKFIDQSYGKQPGQITDTIGYHSKTGYMYYNGKYH